MAAVWNSIRLANRWARYASCRVRNTSPIWSSDESGPPIARWLSSCSSSSSIDSAARGKVAFTCDTFCGLARLDAWPGTRPEATFCEMLNTSYAKLRPDWRVLLVPPRPQPNKVERLVPGSSSCEIALRIVCGARSWEVEMVMCFLRE
jgi:hypothetical protein